jgi:tetratricopeptide (TPR) repeat protein
LKKRKVSLPDHDHSERLLEVLAFIPLAITQAAAFINQTTMSIQDYLALLEKNNENFKDALSTELQDSRRQIGFPNSVFRTWKLSFDQILNQNPRAGELLSLMAMLDHHHIPKRWLQSSTERQVDFELALGILDGFALITKAMAVDAFALHPLVQASIQYWLENEQMIEETTQKALELLDRASVTDSSFDPPRTREFEPISPHTQAVLSHCRLLKIVTIPFANLSMKLADFEYLNAKLDAALQSASEAHGAFQAILGDFARETLRSLRSQANTLAFKGNAELAEEVFGRALSGYEKMSKPDNRGRIACIRELAAVLQEDGKHNEAEDLC